MNKKKLIGVLISTLFIVVSTGCLIGGNGGGGPPPPPPTTGELWVTLNQQSPGSAIYEGKSGDPPASKPHVIITSVTNPGSYDYSLAHIDRNGRRIGFIILDHGITDSVSFSGLEVQGDWTAQYSGDMRNAPMTMSVTVKWKAP